MKLSIILMVVFTLNLSATGFGQFSFVSEGKNVREVMDIIEKESNYRFFYNDEFESVDKVIDLEFKNKNINQILNKLLASTDYTYKIFENNLIVLSLKDGISEQPGFQQNIVKGTVTDELGNALPGVTIIVKGTTRGTTTDINGNYAIEVESPQSVLACSFVGYVTQEITVGNRTQINISLAESVVGLDEVVVVGYGTQKKASITGAISSMASEKVAVIPIPNLSNGLSGRISGVYVNQGSGIPGYAADIRVRSVNTWKSTGTSPLYVIDGVILDKTSFDALDYSEVESITVLKDAASGAIYGARAANGVILVTTKTGQTGKFKLEYNFSYSMDEPSKFPEYMNMADAVKYQNLSRAASGGQPFADEQEVAYYQNNDPAKDYFDKAYRPALLQKHSLSGSGGTDKVKYFVSASYFDQTGFIETTGFEKFNIRTNLDLNFTENLSGTFKFSYNEGTTSRFSYQEDMASTFDPSSTGGFLIGRLLYYLAFTRPMTSDGKYINPGWIGNPLAFVEGGGSNINRDNNTDFLIGLNYKIPFIKGLSVASRFSRNQTMENIKHYEIKPTVYDVVRQGTHGLIYTDEIIGSRKTSYPSKEKLGQRQISNRSYQLNFEANYQRTFGLHNVNALFVYEQSEGFDNIFYGVRENFPLLQRDQLWATGSSRNDSYIDGSEYETGRASFIGRVGYEYADKYFLNATLRRDGSMLFAPDYRWGNFPSVSAGWVISQESFWSVSFVNFLKLRASWGLSGNDAVGGWKWAESFSTAGSFMIGSAMQPRVAYNGIVNEELTWEKTREFNIGIDSRILEGVIFNLEYYFRHNFDILDSRIVSLPASFGGTMPPVNYGIVNAKGVEFEAGYSGRFGKLNYDVRGNFTYATNKVKEKDIPQNVRDVNNPINRSTDYVACLVSTGIIRTQAQLDALPTGYTIYGKIPALGALNFEDVSGLEPGKPDGKIDDYDRQVLKGKHYLPPYTYGLNLAGDWKGIGADIFFQGVVGVAKMYNDGYGRRFHGGVRPPSFWLDSWTPDNTDAAYPQAVEWDYTYDHLESTFWLKKGNYLRLQHLNLFYSLPSNITNKIGMSEARIMLTGANLFTLTPFEYYDPTVTEIRGYPTMRTYSVGVKVTF